MVSIWTAWSSTAPILAQVNFGGGWSSLVGIVLALSGTGLYFLRTFRPTLARDYDIAFAVVALVCGGILFFNGWRQDPILQFGQLMLTASAIWFAVEAIRLRGIATEQAKRSTPIVDDERPVSRVYRAELDDLPPLNEKNVTRRIRGERDGRPGRNDYEDVRRPSSSRDRMDSSARARRPRSSRPLPPDRTDVRSAWDDDFEDSSPRSTSRSDIRDDRTSSRPRRNRPPQSPSRRRDPGSDPSSSDYVDYQPLDIPDEGISNPRDFD
jgi:hypothetical protein